MQQISVFGLGSFGQFIVSLLPEDLEVTGFDTGIEHNSAVNIRRLTSEEASKADIIILAIPFESLELTLKSIKPFLRPETLVIDVCSVKVKPEELYDIYLPNHRNLLLTHPLFGPQSAAKSTAGHKLIITKSLGVMAEKAIAYCSSHLKLSISRLTAEEHDKVMAQVHALTFFIARGLDEMALPAVPFQTPSYNMILDLVAFNQSHSDQLYNTIQIGNPYAGQARTNIVDALTSLNNSLRKDAND